MKSGIRVKSNSAYINKKSLYYEGPEQRSSDRTIKEIERDLEEEKMRMSKMSWPAVYEGI